MLFKPDDYRWSALGRYHDATLESAVLLLALARRPTHSHHDAFLNDATGMRATIRIMTEMHSFCLNARKSVEIASILDPEIAKIAREICPHQRDTIVEPEIGVRIRLTESNFWWVISRILHSVSVSVVAEFTPLGGSARRIYSETRDRYFAFSSDKDEPTGGPGTFIIGATHTHYVQMEALIGCYTGSLNHRIEEALRSLRTAQAI